MIQAALVVLLTLAGCSRSPDAPLEVFNTVPAFELTAETGEAFRASEQLAGKVWIANFIFTTCNGPCPRMTAQMKQVQTKIEDLADVRMVSFTVDPVNDTPPALAAYARRFGAVPKRWWFLTGSAEALHALSFDTFMLGRVSGQLDHSTRFVLVDRAMRVRKYYDTTEPDAISNVAADARRLLTQQ